MCNNPKKLIPNNDIIININKLKELTDNKFSNQEIEIISNAINFIKQFESLNINYKKEYKNLMDKPTPIKYLYEYYKKQDPNNKIIFEKNIGKDGEIIGLSFFYYFGFTYLPYENKLRVSKLKDILKRLYYRYYIPLNSDIIIYKS